MIEVESRVLTESSPAMRGRAGRAPVLMKMVSAVNVRVPPALSLHLDDFRAGEMRFAENELDILGVFQSTLVPRAEVVHDCLLAPVNLPQVNADRPAANAVVGGAPGQVSDSRAGDHGLRRCAADIDTGAADMLTLYDGCFPSSLGECNGKRRSCLSRPYHDGIIVIHKPTSRVLFALFHPLRAPCGRFEGFGKVLSFMDDPPILKLHNADRLPNRSLIFDDIFGYPKIVHAHDPADRKVAWFIRMMATQSLEVATAKDLLPRLRIFADDIFVVDLVFCFQISGC